MSQPPFPRPPTHFVRRAELLSAAGSLIVHLSLLALMAAILLPAVAGSRGDGTALLGQIETQADALISLEEVAELQLPQTDAALTPLAVAASELAESPANVSGPLADDALPLNIDVAGVRTAQLTRRVAAVSGARGGAGAGGNGFFGLSKPGKSVVFVVDASLSMNHPFPGPARTRFGRVRMELLQTLQNMPADQRFFLIFFNDRAIPMPADRLMEATNGTKQFYAEWMTGLKASAGTVPDEALLLALRLRPDEIYFLTDGDFNPRVVPGVARANQGRVVIHTIGFSDKSGERLLKEIAAQNGGTYTYISDRGDAPSPRD